ncbi:MAG TPA: XdhC family protein [Clostridia bacterium]|nr:XdhC family protein [Clostridia bacterium]
MDKKVIQTIIEEIGVNSPAVLATIVNVSGSVPRHEGAQMLIFPDGRSVGTIGGGCGEAEVRREALIVLDDNKTKSYRVLLNSDLAADEGMVCGGIMDVLLEPLNHVHPYDFVLECLENIRPAVLVTQVSPESKKGVYDISGKKLAGEECKVDIKLLTEVYNKGTTSFVPDDNGHSVLYQPILPEEKLLILGAGHVGQYVASFGKKLDFKVTVVDDRPDFANPSRFPDADQILCSDFGQVLKDYKIDQSTYIVVVTRGHQYDEICLKNILGKPYKYLGMIGSRRRVKLLLTKLENEGYSVQELSRVKTPIGLKIGAETPAEIAISILGEIISVRRLQN